MGLQTESIEIPPFEQDRGFDSSISPYGQNNQPTSGRQSKTAVLQKLSERV